MERSLASGSPRAVPRPLPAPAAAAASAMAAAAALAAAFLAAEPGAPRCPGMRSARDSSSVEEESEVLSPSRSRPTRAGGKGAGAGAGAEASEEGGEAKWMASW